MRTDLESLKRQWLEEESAEFSGWDFSHIEQRYRSEPLRWSYADTAKGILRPTDRLLDMGTGGGELLESLGHPYELTSVTEGWDVNLRLCRERLEPKGVRVEEWSDPPQPLPFEDDSFDVVLNSHESYGFDEVFRVLKQGGHFLTEQVGGENSANLSAILAPGRSVDSSFNLANEMDRAIAAGFEVAFAAEQFPVAKIYDVGALVWFCRVIVWEFPGFSVERCFDRLVELQEKLERDGFIENREHRFIMMLRKA